jgi:uncharacterized membrane protein YphA (DoxX/SURF4 family)
MSSFRQEVSDLLLRLGSALALLYPPIDAFLNPFSWVGYLPEFVRDNAPEMFVLHAFGILQIVLAVWILSGKKIFVPCVVASVMLMLTVLVNLNDFEVLFRDLSIAMMTLALAVTHRPSRRS